MKKKFFVSLISLFLLTNAFPVKSAQFYFENGDLVSGEILSLKSGMVTANLQFDGKVTFSQEKLNSITTQEKMTVRLVDGSYLTGRMVRTKEGLIGIQTDQNHTIKPFKIDRIDQIFREDPRETLRKKLQVKLTGEVNGGFSRQSGNTNKESYDLDGQMRARTPRNRYTLGFEYHQEQTDDNLTEENALAFGKYDHFFKEKWYLFTSTTLLQDTFQNLSLRSTLNAGLGHQIYDQSDEFLLLELGAGYTNETYEDNTPATNYFNGRYAIDYEKDIYSNTTLFHFQEGLLGTGEDGDFNFRSQTGFKFPLLMGLQSKFQFNLDWDQEPTGGNVNTDREYIYSMGYTF